MTRKLNKTMVAGSVAGLALTLVTLTATPAHAVVRHFYNSRSSDATVQVYAGINCKGPTKFVPRGGKSPFTWTKSFWIYPGFTAYMDGQPPPTTIHASSASGRCKNLVPSMNVNLNLQRW